MASITRPLTRYCSCAIQHSLRVSIRTTSPASTIPLHKRQSRPSRRWASTESSKIGNIVDQIGHLTLLETADLVSTLKSRLNIPDMPMGNFSGGSSGPAAAAAPVEEEEAAPKAQEKTLFNLTLKSFDATSKPKVIKEIKSLLNLSLVESKKFAESAPKQMQENVSKEDAEKIIATMKAIGAVVTMD